MKPCRVLLLGATGTIGRATARELVGRGHTVVCPVRAPRTGEDPRRGLPPGVEVRATDLSDPDSIRRDAFRGESFAVLLSCMASRTGVPRDAWAVDYQAHSDVLEAALEHGVEHVVLLSALCVQRPRLAFQRAKLAFEAELRASGLRWSIVRATAFFKSVSGQVERVKAGRPFLVFGDGTGTSSKPIGDRDLAEYLVGCLDEPDRWDQVLPIGGPGPALTPLRQGELLFEAAGMEPRFRHVPVAFLHAVAGLLTTAARWIPPLREKAELARIGRYYATESMLVWDPVAARFDADATPEYGSETLAEYYRKRIRGEVADERGEHAVF